MGYGKKFLETPKTRSDFVIKAILTGLIYAISSYCFSFMFRFLQVQPIGGDPFLGLVLTVIGGVILGLVLGFVSVRFTFSLLPRSLLLFSVLFVIGFASNIVEYLFFSTTSVSALSYEMITIVTIQIVTAVAIALLFPPMYKTDSVGSHLMAFFSDHSTTWWAFRIFVAGAAYVPIYLFFGGLVSPIVLPYYNDPSLGLGLITPSFAVILPLEIVRGIIYVLLLIPPMAMAKLKKWDLVLYLTAILAGIGAIVPLITNQLWPLVLRVTHGAEITVDSFVHAFVMAKVLKKFSEE